MLIRERNNFLHIFSPPLTHRARRAHPGRGPHPHRAEEHPARRRQPLRGGGRLRHTQQHTGGRLRPQQQVHLLGRQREEAYREEDDRECGGGNDLHGHK